MVEVLVLAESANLRQVDGLSCHALEVNWDRIGCTS